MVDVRASEAHHVGDQSMGVMELLVDLKAHRRFAMPTEGIEGFAHKLLRLCDGQVALGFENADELERARRKDVALAKDSLRLGTKGLILDQVEAQQRGEYPERVAPERGIVDRPKGRGMNGHAGHRQIIIADRVHPQHGKDATHVEQFVRAPQANGAVTLDVQPLEFIVPLEARSKLLVLAQRFAIGVVDELHQSAVLRHFGPVHVRHGAGKQGANLVRVRAQRWHQSLHLRADPPSALARSKDHAISS